MPLSFVRLGRRTRAGDVVAVGDRVPRADFEAGGKAPLEFDAHARVLGEKAAGAHRCRQAAVRHAIVERRQRGDRFVFLETEVAGEIALAQPVR
jgi:hypothetical protein